MKRPADDLDVAEAELDPMGSIELASKLDQNNAERLRRCDASSMRCNVLNDICVTYYLRGEWQEVRKWSEELIKSVDYYLFGDWREHDLTDDGIVCPEWWFSRKQSVAWVVPLAHGLSWAAIIGKWAAVDRLLEFPNEDVGPDLDGRVPRAFYIELAKWWKDRSHVKWFEEVKRMRGAGSREIHLRCDVLQAINAGDAELAAKSFATYLKFWVDRVKTAPHRIALDAAFLWHLALRQGIEIALPDNLKIHLIRLGDDI